MNMLEWLRWVWIFGAGFGLGLFFYGGLWLTVKQLTRTAVPGALFFFSFLGRTLVSVVGIYLLSGQQVANVLISVLGFMLARLLAVRLWGGLNRSNLVLGEELAHATKS